MRTANVTVMAKMASPHSNYLACDWFFAIVGSFSLV